MSECEDEMKFTEATELAQIISGSAFIGLAMWLIFANTSRVTVAHKATYEQRLTVCVAINCAVALFSGFFNILQLTSIDNFSLPRQTNFTLDLARPIEWIATCPIMQLCLCLMGGPRIPPYRRFMMPLLSVSLLLCGTASMFTQAPVRFAWYSFGMLLALIMFWHNILQIRENSDGSESILRGSSDFRVLSIYLIATWFPFPAWFALSPEGFGVITDIVVIHMGWVVLNIVSKFGFVIYLQNVKTAYCNKLRATRELYGVEPSGHQGEDPLKNNALTLDQISPLDIKPRGLRPTESTKSLMDPDKFMTLVSETMSSLGMREHTERFQKLLVQAKIISIEQLNQLTDAECVDMQLPSNLVTAVQRKHRMEMMEKAEMQLDFPPPKYALADGFHRDREERSTRPSSGKSQTADLPSFGHEVPSTISGMPLMMMELSEASQLRMQQVEDRLSLLLLKMDEQRDHISNQVTAQLGAHLSQEAQKQNEQLMQSLMGSFLAQFADQGNALAQHVAGAAGQAAADASAHALVQYGAQQRDQFNEQMRAQRDQLSEQMTQIPDRLVAKVTAKIAAMQASPMTFGVGGEPSFAPAAGLWQSDALMADLQQRDERRDHKLQEIVQQQMEQIQSLQDSLQQEIQQRSQEQTQRLEEQAQRLQQNLYSQLPKQQSPPTMTLPMQPVEAKLGNDQQEAVLLRSFDGRLEQIKDSVVTAVQRVEKLVEDVGHGVRSLPRGEGPRGDEPITPALQRMEQGIERIKQKTDSTHADQPMISALQRLEQKVEGVERRVEGTSEQPMLSALQRMEQRFERVEQQIEACSKAGHADESMMSALQRVGQQLERAEQRTESGTPGEGESIMSALQRMEQKFEAVDKKMGSCLGAEGESVMSALQRVEQKFEAVDRKLEVGPGAEGESIMSALQRVEHKVDSSSKADDSMVTSVHRIEQRLERVEAMSSAVQRLEHKTEKVDSISTAMQRVDQKVERVEQKMEGSARVDSMLLVLQRMEQKVDRCEHKVESTSRDSGSRVDSMASAVQRMEQKVERFEQKVESCSRPEARPHGDDAMMSALQRVEQKVDSVEKRVEVAQDHSAARIQDAENRILHQVEECSRIISSARDQTLTVAKEAASAAQEAVSVLTKVPEHTSPLSPDLRSEERMKAHSESMKRDINGLLTENIGKLNSSIESAMKTTVGAVEERLVDIRRMNMMVMEMITSMQERTEAITDACSRKLSAMEGLQPDTIARDLGHKMEDTMRAVVISELCRMKNTLEELLFGTSPRGNTQSSQPQGVEAAGSNRLADLEGLSNGLDGLTNDLTGLGDRASEAASSLPVLGVDGIQPHNPLSSIPELNGGNNGLFGKKIVELCRSLDLTCDRLMAGASRFENLSGAGVVVPASGGSSGSTSMQADISAKYAEISAKQAEDSAKQAKEMRDALKQISTQLTELEKQMGAASKSMVKVSADVCKDGTLSEQITQMQTKIGEGMQKFEFAISKILKALPSSSKRQAEAAASKTVAPVPPEAS